MRVEDVLVNGTGIGGEWLVRHHVEIHGRIVTRGSGRGLLLLVEEQLNTVLFVFVLDTAHQEQSI